MELSSNSTCRQIEELLPLLKNGRISSQDRLAVELHLKRCIGCSGLYAQLSPLFDAVSRPAAIQSDSAHPLDEELAAYVLHPDELTQELRAGVESHLTNCESCSQFAKQLVTLPRVADDLLNSSTAPELTQIDTEFQQAQSKTREWKRRPFFWNATTGYIAAAAILVIILYRNISTPPKPDIGSSGPTEVAVVQAEFPTMTRAAADSIVFEIPTAQARLALICDVSPESGHRYSIDISPAKRDTILEAWEDIRQFDSRGRFSGIVRLEPGNYRLRLLDIVSNDTVIIVRPFEVHMSAK